jgi:hypothetical protein
MNVAISLVLVKAFLHCSHKQRNSSFARVELAYTIEVP